MGNPKWATFIEGRPRAIRTRFPVAITTWARRCWRLDLKAYEPAGVGESVRLGSLTAIMRPRLCPRLTPFRPVWAQFWAQSVVSS